MSEREDLLNALAATLDKTLPTIYNIERVGFVLLTFSFDIESKSGDYVSNANRSDIIKALREVADRLENKEDIGRPIGEA
jgi:hypothetical protein